MRKLMISALMGVIVGWAGVSFACDTCGCQLAKADHGHDHPAAVNTKSAAVDNVMPAAVNAGNKVCPIMGGPVSAESANNVEYNGKIYNLCCAGCKEAFLKDPEAALKKLAELEPVAAVK